MNFITNGTSVISALIVIAMIMWGFITNWLLNRLFSLLKKIEEYEGRMLTLASNLNSLYVYTQIGRKPRKEWLEKMKVEDPDYYDLWVKEQQLKEGSENELI